MRPGSRQRFLNTVKDDLKHKHHDDIKMYEKDFDDRLGTPKLHAND